MTEERDIARRDSAQWETDRLSRSSSAAVDSDKGLLCCGILTTCCLQTAATAADVAGKTCAVGKHNQDLPVVISPHRPRECHPTSPQDTLEIVAESKLRKFPKVTAQK